MKHQAGYLIHIIYLAGMLLWLPASLLLAQDATPGVDGAGLTIHVVQRDETMFRIALQYNTSVDVLAEINGITNAGSIQVGQRLLVPTGEISTATPQTHTIQPGETLSSIATLYAIPIADLQTANNIVNPNQVYPGQVLQILNSTTSTIPTLAPTPTDTTLVVDAPVDGLHTVAVGETLFRIAQQYNLDVNDIASANGITDPTRIFAGQQLIIPTVAATTLVVELPAPLTALSVNPLIFVEGETGSISVTTSAPVTITGTFLDTDLRVIAQEGNTRHVMLVGVPIYTEAGIYPFTLNISNNGVQTEYTLTMRVAAGGYGSQSITVTSDLAPLLAQAPQDYEFDLLKRLTSTFTETKYWDGAFGLPAAAAMNSTFGTRRSYNGGIYNGFHTGADFASAPGAPVFAAASGKVILADLLNIRGNTLIIDHGWGVFSVYSHQSALVANLGDMVTTGQIIGAAGATGRITGPHLHWEIWVNGTPVNPLQWAKRSFP